MAVSTTPHKLTRAERRARAVELRKTGKTFEQIGAELGVTKQAAHGLVKAELADLMAKRTEGAEEIIALEIQRLDAMLEAIWPRIMGEALLAKIRDDNAELGEKIAALEEKLPDIGVRQDGAILNALRIMARRSALLGLDAPKKVAPTNPDGDEPWQPEQPLTAEERAAEIMAVLKDATGRQEGTGTTDDDVAE